MSASQRDRAQGEGNAAGAAMEARIFELVPIGEGNATTARLIWQCIDLGTVATVKLKLNTMVAQGLIERKRLPTWSAETNFYFKKPSALSDSHPHLADERFL